MRKLEGRLMMSNCEQQQIPERGQRGQRGESDDTGHKTSSRTDEIFRLKCLPSGSKMNENEAASTTDIVATSPTTHPRETQRHNLMIQTQS